MGKSQSTGCSASMPIKANIEDRNRTAPFPFCGNRFEFRAVGSSQNCSLPVMICNTIMAAGMAELSKKIEGGMNARDAVADMYKVNRNVIFTGNGYSAEWPVEAAARGLPNLNTTPLAVATFNSKKAKEVFNAMGVFADDECDARQEVMYENYNTVLSIEVDTMIKMVETGILPACAQDMASYAAMPALAGERAKTYEGIMSETKKLKDACAGRPHDLAKEAEYLCNVVKPQMAKVREVVDKAEGLLQKGLYPYPTYEDLIYSHHS